jgi:cytochrome c biogenesis protein CcmG/thiol:disulfide interchange protein DsbE
MRVYWPVTFAAAALVGLLAYGLAARGTDQSIDQAMARGERVNAPATALPRLGTAATGSVEAYRGKVVVLNFWASWCPPCRDEMPVLQQAHERIAARGGTVLGVDVQDGAEAALAFTRSRGITFPSLRDRDGDYARGFAISGYPETFVLDRAGRVAAARRGPVTSRWLDEHVTPLLGEEA